MNELEKLEEIVDSMRPPYISKDGEYYSGTFMYPDFSNALLYETFKEILRLLTLSTKGREEGK